MPDTKSPILVFDGHNDILSRLMSESRKNPTPMEARFLQGDPHLHIDLPRARTGGLAGGLCAVYVPSPGRHPDQNGDLPQVERASALDQTLAQAALLRRLEAASDAALRICRSAAEIRYCLEAGIFAAVFHIEGFEAAGPDLDLLEVLHAAGLASLGPVWSRPNIFAHGVPFRFGHSPDIGPGLTNAGRDLVRACNRLKIMIDLSHMNDAGFWDVARLSDAPLVASHSNAFAICPHSRNATDRQLDAIRDTQGLIGLNFGVRFLHPQGVMDAELELAVMVRHIDYLVERVGIDHVAFGSDFDGTLISRKIGSAEGLPRLIDALRQAGYDDDALEKIGHRNWIALLERTWGR
ncbi:dipeptidase [Rhizobium sp. SSA_523]|uniref:dipeptidase n=1 Tax=Rhizobium sp. SSA_523 TaxID=2952477 RepID=UPI0020917229|nr:dipeptidase [Rhizobium sp. SSA_523]MCO5731208.1 dipeptidase [Rhizobium sp. SSA_523]WKC22250.1 dipeptidase [Rhizobium sp. SSA_523]